MKNKSLLIIIIIITLFYGCNNTNNIKFAEIEYKKSISFGIKNNNDTIVKTFQIKNISKNNLIIKNIKSSCGCTVAKLKNSTILPNKYAEIVVTYIPQKKGDVSNSIVFEANTNPTFNVLYLKGEIH